MKLATQTHLASIDGVYHYRRRIPKDLIAIYSPKREIKFSLKTKDKRKAEQLARIESVRVDQEFSLHRAKLHQKDLPHTLTKEDIATLTQNFFQEVLLDDDEHRKNGQIDEAYLEGLEEARYIYKENYAEGHKGNISNIVNYALDEHGLNVSTQSQGYKDLTFAFIETGLKALKIIEQRQQGELIETPPAPKKMTLGSSHHNPNNMTLLDILDKWRLEKTPSNKTINEWKRCIEKFEKVNGQDLSIDQITKPHIVAFKDDRVKDGVKWATTKKYLGIIHSLLQYASNNAYIQFNPATGVKVAKPKVSEDSRLPFSIENLNTIFSHPIFQDKTLPPMSGAGRQTDSAGEAAYWLPLLSLYTGARPSELCQLTKDDVFQEIGCWIISINNYGRKTIKTESSKRKVPLHSELIRLGFTDYCNKQTDFIFPLLKTDSGGNRYNKFGDWANARFLRKDCQITNTKLNFYSFRHSFKDACRNSAIPLEIQEAFMGHAGSTVGSSTSGQGGYGLGYSVKTLGEWMSKLSYEGLLKLK
jgi:integrase